MIPSAGRWDSVLLTWDTRIYPWLHQVFISNFIYLFALAIAKIHNKKQEYNNTQTVKRQKKCHYI